jgi:hypothetical protein
MTKIEQPIVIFGGFLSYAGLYHGMQVEMETITGHPVLIVNTKGYDWLPTITVQGWIYLLRKLDKQVIQAADRASSGKVTIFAHSIGGVLARIYLLDNSIPGEKFHGREAVTHLVTLGSPHKNKGGVTRGGLLNRWIDRNYPGGTNVMGIKYTTIAGKYICGNHTGSSMQRWVYRNYKSVSGKGNVWGDGLIPVNSALLDEAEQIVLEGVSHAKIFGDPWYGDPQVIERILAEVR